MEMFSINNRIAIVTGALGLIGREHCYALSEAGAKVVVADLNGKLAQDFAETLETDSIGVELNVADKQSVTSAKETILNKYGTIDILVNNAAINDMFESPKAATEQSKFENYPLEIWQKSLDVNLTGVFLCSQVFGTVMAEKGKGSIINIASTYGITGPDQTLYIKEDGSQDFFKPPAYTATKGGVIAFTKFLSSYWGVKGVRVNTLTPGGVENKQDPYFIKKYSAKTTLKRMAKASDYRGAVVFLASDASEYVTGANLVVDGGWTII